MYFHSEMWSNPSQMMIDRLYFCVKHLSVCFVMSSSSRHDLCSQSTIQQHLVNEYFIQRSAVQMLSVWLFVLSSCSLSLFELNVNTLIKERMCNIDNVWYLLKLFYLVLFRSNAMLYFNCSGIIQAHSQRVLNVSQYFMMSPHVIFDFMHVALGRCTQLICTCKMAFCFIWPVDFLCVLLKSASVQRLCVLVL